MRRARVVAGIWAVASVAMAAEAPAFEFRGHKIGEPIEVSFSNPKRQCTAAGVLVCQDMKTGKIGDTEVALAYTYYEGRLFGVGMTFPETNFVGIRDMLTGRYGEPATAVTEEMQTPLGAKYASAKITWRFAEGDLVLDQRFGSINKSGLVFSDAAATARLEAANKASRQAAGRGAF